MRCETTCSPSRDTFERALLLSALLASARRARLADGIVLNAGCRPVARCTVSESTGPVGRVHGGVH
eukprot:3541185-Pyramimonas_sp.AAC.1